MAEAEDVITDIARHATIYARDLWKRHYQTQTVPQLALSDVSHRLDLLVRSAFNQSFTIRTAQLPPPPTLLARVFRRSPAPWCTQAIPATDGTHIWLPPRAPFNDVTLAHQWFRTLALRLATRALRKSSNVLQQLPHPVARDMFLIVESVAADNELSRIFPGTRKHIDDLRKKSLNSRPPLNKFSQARRPLELFYRRVLTNDFPADYLEQACLDSPDQSLNTVNRLLPEVMKFSPQFSIKSYGTEPLVKDVWTGEILPPDRKPAVAKLNFEEPGSDNSPRSARLPRQPKVREAKEDEDKENNNEGAWMVQGEESHPKAEDPMGLQRPVDRDNPEEPDEYADLVSELTEARLVSTPGQSKEVLLGDDMPDKRSCMERPPAKEETVTLTYPEWNYRDEQYLIPGAKVRINEVLPGPQQWVDDTTEHYRPLIHNIQRQFEVLQARRVTYRQQMDGEEIDLDAYVNSYANFKAGDSLSQALYQTRRVAQRNVAISLLVDTSGSTDSWISENRRVIDVEREALLLVAIALQTLGEPYSILAFSGEGPNAVTVHQVKTMEESYSNEIAQRIGSLQPEKFTRLGAALRHTTTELMYKAAAHRLLIVLSDGKPNDNDEYEGIYGIEDTRQAVTEAKAQGVQVFCLTIDRQAASYLSRIFGAHQYALLPHPQELPRVLLEWMKRLLLS